MRLIKPSFEIIEQRPGLEGIYKQIELAGRTCYKSEDKITEDSAKGFVERMIASKHYAMLEHGTVYLSIDNMHNKDIWDYFMNKYSHNLYTVVVSLRSDYLKRLYITTNLKVLLEKGWLEDLQFICEPTEHHAKRVTVHFICDRGVSHKKFVA